MAIFLEIPEEKPEKAAYSDRSMTCVLLIKEEESKC